MQGENSDFFFGTFFSSFRLGLDHLLAQYLVFYTEYPF